MIWFITPACVLKLMPLMSAPFVEVEINVHGVKCSRSLNGRRIALAGVCVVDSRRWQVPIIRRYTRATSRAGSSRARGGRIESSRQAVSSGDRARVLHQSSRLVNLSALHAVDSLPVKREIDARMPRIISVVPITGLGNGRLYGLYLARYCFHLL